MPRNHHSHAGRQSYSNRRLYPAAEERVIGRQENAGAVARIPQLEAGDLCTQPDAAPRRVAEPSRAEPYAHQTGNTRQSALKNVLKTQRHNS